MGRLKDKMMKGKDVSGGEPKGPPPLKQEPKAEPQMQPPQRRIATPIEEHEKARDRILLGMPPAVPPAQAEPQREAPAVTIAGTKPRAPDAEEDKNLTYSTDGLRALIGMHQGMTAGKVAYSEKLVMDKVWETYEHVMKIADPGSRIPKLTQLASYAARFGTDFKSEALLTEGKERFAEVLFMAEREGYSDDVTKIKEAMARRGLLEKPEEKQEEKVVLAPEVQAEIAATQRTSKPPLSQQDEQARATIRELTKANKFKEAWNVVGKIKNKTAKCYGIEEIADAYERKKEYKEALNAASKIKDNLFYGRVVKEIALAQMRDPKTANDVLAARKTLRMAKNAIIDESESQERSKLLAEINTMQGELEETIRKNPAYSKLDGQLTRKKWYKGIGALLGVAGSIGIAILTDAYGRDVMDYLTNGFKYGFVNGDATKKTKKAAASGEGDEAFKEAISERVDGIDGRVGAIEVQLPDPMRKVYSDVYFSKFKDGKIRAVVDIDAELKAAEKAVGKTYIELSTAKTLESVESEIALETDAKKKTALENEKALLALGEEKAEREKLNNYLELDRQGFKNQLCTSEGGDVTPISVDPLEEGPLCESRNIYVVDATGKIKSITVYDEKKHCTGDCKGKPGAPKPAEIEVGIGKKGGKN